MQQSPSWEANWFSASHKIPRILQKPKVHYRTYKCNHLSLSWARSIQSIPPSHFLKIYLNIILLSMPGSSKQSLSLRFPHQNPAHTSLLPCTSYMPCPCHSSWFDHPNNIWWGVQITSYLHSPATSSLSGPNIPLSTLFSNTPSLQSSLNVSHKVSHLYKTTGKIIVLYILIFKFYG